MTKPEFPHGYFDGGEEGLSTTYYPVTWRQKTYAVEVDPSYRPEFPMFCSVEGTMGTYNHLEVRPFETVWDALDRASGNAADGDRDVHEPKDYGAGAEMCSCCNGKKVFLVTGWIAIRDYIPGEIAECLPSLRYIVCEVCHGLGVVAVKEE